MCKHKLLMSSWLWYQCHTDFITHWQKHCSSLMCRLSLFSSMQSLPSAWRCLEEGRRKPPLLPLPAEILEPRRRRKRRMSTLEDSVKALPNIFHICCFRLLREGASMSTKHYIPVLEGFVFQEAFRKVIWRRKASLRHPCKQHVYETSSSLKYVYLFRCAFQNSC